LNPIPKFFTKGFVKGRNISEANRLIQDVIEYTDREDDDGIIIFLDQQKGFDRVEWGWVDHLQFRISSRSPLLCNRVRTPLYCEGVSSFFSKVSFTSRKNSSLICSQ
jgi:hypothetical protein